MSVPPPPQLPPRRRPPTPPRGTGSSRYGLDKPGRGSGTGPAAPRKTPAKAPGDAAPPTKPPKVRRGRSGWRRWLPTWRMIWVTALSGFVLVSAGVAYLWFSTPIPKEASAFSQIQGTTVLYSDGTVLGNIGATNRHSLDDLKLVPLVVQHAVLAAEDRKFYSEPGISITGIARAVLVDLSGGHVQGGSTITQQYAKNAYLTQKRTLSRKLREVVIAEKLDLHYTKDSVLLAYLNTIYFGRGSYGIQAASKAYFGKDVSKLNAAEGAVLAAAIQRPSYLDPLVHPQASEARWTYVINGMIAKGWLDTAPIYPLKNVVKYTPVRVTGPNAFVIDAVQKELDASTIDQAKLALGATIVTTIDKNAQAAAIKAEDDQLNSKVRSLTTKNPPVSALVAMQPSDGAIRAMYGGQGSSNGDCSVREGGCLNLATQGLFQPGSSFKPYVLATSELWGNGGLLTRVNGPAVLPDPPGADIHNDNGDAYSNITLTNALAQSVNTVYVPLARQVGPPKVAIFAHQAGIPASITLADAGQTTDRIALGVYPVHPIDQATGYATLCNGGNRITPFLVRSVKSQSGESLYKAKTPSVNVIDPKITADVDYAMQQVVASGTGKGAALGARQVAGKTGTTQNNTNAWFVGCTAPAKTTGQLVTAVWVGHAATVTPLTDIPGFEKGLFGGQIPADIFHDFMTTAMAGKPLVSFPAPAYYFGPKPASPVTAAPTTTPSPTKTTPTPKPTKTTPKPVVTTTTQAVVTTAPTSTAPVPTSAAAPPPPTSAAAVTTTAAPTTTTAPPAQPPAAGAAPSG
ncbi:transglycosylase/D,D-transpeptidase PonA1 [Acidothermaceae bacterium B102]|nr:transglycosylase/D,D-transpeptidase PonA1 [Acidothermaceae bacterium B102]